MKTGDEIITKWTLDSFYDLIMNNLNPAISMVMPKSSKSKH